MRPEPRYFSIPSIVVGAEVPRCDALNWTPCVRSFTHEPLAWMNSPGEIAAAWPTTVTRPRRPRSSTRRTENPFSSLWKVTRSTVPESVSGGGGCSASCRIVLILVDGTVIPANAGM
jgi:hypothetical protein